VQHGRLWAALADVEGTRCWFRACADAAGRAIALLADGASVDLARSYAQLLNALENLRDPRAAGVRAQAIAAARAAGDDSCTWYLLCNDAVGRINDAADAGLDDAERELAEALTIAERMQRDLFTTATRSYLARLDGRRGRFVQARQAMRAVVDAQRELGAEPYLGHNLVNLAWLERECGNPIGASAAAAEGVEISIRLENDAVMLSGLEEFAAALHARGDAETAAVLRGFTGRRTALDSTLVPQDEHVARHAPLGEALRRAYPAAHARGERAEFREILGLLVVRPIAARFENSREQA
jgi:hypothetical protein